MGHPPSSTSDFLEPGITALLQRASAGNTGAERELISLLYGRLRSIARREQRRLGPAATRSATEAVHEAFMQLVRERPRLWPDRRYFFAAFARAVHDRMVDDVRKRQRRGRHEALDEAVPRDVDSLRDVEILALRELLPRLEEAHPRQAEVLRLHYFLELSILEIADALEVGHATVERDLRFARAWLHARLRP